jgi:hypothetical protein
MAQYWMAVTEPAFPWEREALSYIRQRLPEQEPFRAWSNFEFVADDGSINEVDLLVVSLYKLYLVEIKSPPAACRAMPAPGPGTTPAGCMRTTTRCC